MAWTRHEQHSILIPGDLTAAEQKNIYLCQAADAASSISVTIVPSQDVTENDTDYIELEVNSATGSSATLTAMMTKVTTKDTGGIDLNQGVAYAFTLTTSTLAEGSWLVLEITKGGSGKALPPCTVSVQWELGN